MNYGLQITDYELHILNIELVKNINRWNIHEEQVSHNNSMKIKIKQQNLKSKSQKLNAKNPKWLKINQLRKY